MQKQNAYAYGLNMIYQEEIKDYNYFFRSCFEREIVSILLKFERTCRAHCPVGRRHSVHFCVASVDIFNNIAKLYC